MTGVGSTSTGGDCPGPAPAGAGGAPAWEPLPSDLDVLPVGRHPTTLSGETTRVALGLRVPTSPSPPGPARPRASLVIVTYNNLAYTKLCLASLLAGEAGETFEVVVVDNGSRDGTRDFLAEVERSNGRVRAVYNEGNAGFAAANNRGLSLARGDVLVLLNNDTIVTPGWLGGLVRHLGDSTLGLVGPCTNRIGNEAEIKAGYRTYGELVEFARGRARAHSGMQLEIPMLAMFCLAMRRDVFDRLGTIDERFGIGMFEDDDYSRRAREAGYRVACAEDVFVHHFGQASFGALVPNGEYGDLFRRNRRLFEEKWGVAWESHEHRADRHYQRVVGRVRDAVRSVVPPGATVLVISKGDDELLDLQGMRAWHYPREDAGTYAGHCPADSDEAVAHLEALRGRGAEYLVVPATALWWLDHYGGFRAHLDGVYRAVWSDEAVGAIYSLTPVHS